MRFVYDLTEPGDPCYDGGGPGCINEANYVFVEHADGTQTLYAHLSQVAVSVGQGVARGEIVGFSGSTGYSTGPHAHVQREQACGAPFCGSIPLEFVEVVWGDGQKIDRQIIRATDVTPVGTKHFSIPFDATGKKWVRFAAWDSAVDGAFVQPIWLHR